MPGWTRWKAGLQAESPPQHMFQLRGYSADNTRYVAGASAKSKAVRPPAPWPVTG
jgi:hypothetical protein